MHREIQIKQFPIVTTHWWPKTWNERFVWENEQYLYRFLPLVHNHVQVIRVRTRIWCVTCVCARSGSRCIHTGHRRQRLTEGVSEAWCWRNFSSANGGVSTITSTSVILKQYNRKDPCGPMAVYQNHKSFCYCYDMALFYIKAWNHHPLSLCGKEQRRHFFKITPFT